VEVGDYDMPCYYPQKGFMYVKAKYGKGLVKKPCMRPCGQCRGCRLEQSRQWALRSVHEAQLNEDNSFITLTFRCKKTCPAWIYHHDEKGRYIPGTKCIYSVDKRDMQLFFKRLRKYYGNYSFRYLACGEYGENLGRRHYHAIIFGIDFKDKEIIHQARYKSYKNRFTKSTGDNTLYKSEILGKLWKEGFHTIGDVTFESCGYVARYCMKKITGPQAAWHYNGRKPEFALMSKGLGKDWYKKYKTDLYPKDFVTCRGIKMQPPKYYDRLLEKEDPKLFNEIKMERRKHVSDISADERVRRGKVKELITDRNLKRSLS
jgi:hypothetical protein